MYRQLKVYLKCNQSAKYPVATTDGDSKVFLTYVSNKITNTDKEIDLFMHRRSSSHHVKCVLVVVEKILHPLHLFIYLSCVHQSPESHHVCANILMASLISFPMQMYLGRQRTLFFTISSH